MSLEWPTFHAKLYDSWSLLCVSISHQMEHSYVGPPIDHRLYFLFWNEIINWNFTDEFFKQRRRWGPSTAVNIFELITNAKQAVTTNNYITILYILYQLLFLVLQSIGVCCTMLIMWEALELGLNRTLRHRFKNKDSNIKFLR